MKKRPVAIVTTVVLVAAGVVAWTSFGGCGNPKTRIAQRKTYDAPAAPAPAAGEEWPKWRGPRGDGISRGTRLPDKFPSGGPRQLWSAEVGLGYSSPVAADGVVYLFSLNTGGGEPRESLTAFDAHSGQILWNQEAGGGWPKSYAGTRATPAIDNGRIYTYGGAGDLICRDARTGDARWRVNILKETGAKNIDWGTASSPLVAGNRVFVQSGEGGPVAVAVDADSGSIAWQSQARGLGGYAHPILVDVAGTPQLVVFGGNTVYGMNPDTGATIWSESWPTSYGVNATTPVYSPDDQYLFVTSAYGQGALMLKLRPDGATRVWQKSDVQSRFQGAVLDGDGLYVNSEGTITYLSWPGGDVGWRAEDRNLRLGVGGSFVRADDKLLLLSERGKMSIARATPQGVTLLDQADVFDGTQIWSTPLLYRGRLYAKGTQEFTCFQIAPEPPPAAGPATTTTAPAE